MIESAGLRLTVDCSELDASAWVDAGLFEKIVLNLLSNAFKFTFEGGITVTLRQHGQYAVLAVSDTGVGIADDQQQSIFATWRACRASAGMCTPPPTAARRCRQLYSLRVA